MDKTLLPGRGCLTDLTIFQSCRVCPVIAKLTEEASVGAPRVDELVVDVEA